MPDGTGSNHDSKPLLRGGDAHLAILYVIGIVAFHNRTFTVVGALVFALIAVVGATIVRHDGGGRQRDRSKRYARRYGKDN